MRVRGRLTTAVAGLVTALAAVASLSGCMTVNGENAVVPAVSERDAQRALDRYLETGNEALRDYDAELNATVETGPLGTIREATLTSQHNRNPNGDDAFVPLEISDVAFHIPQQASWPKYFMADAQTSQGRRLLVFTRNSLEEQWLASYMARLSDDYSLELAEDEDGYLEDIPIPAATESPATTESGLATEPTALGEEYAGHLNEGGGGPFFEDEATTMELTRREQATSAVTFVTEFQDLAASGEAFAPVAARTQDGGALVFFATQHHEKQTMAEGETPVVSEEIAALMEGTAERAVTLERIGIQLAKVPQGEGNSQLISRITGVIAATGE